MFRSIALLSMAAFFLCAAAAGDDQSIRAFIQKFAQLRNSGDGAAVAALYAEDGEWIAEGGVRRFHGRAALAGLWQNLPGQVRRTVQAIDTLSNAISVVRVETDYGPPTGVHHEVFVLVKDGALWRIRVHQTTD